MFSVCFIQVQWQVCSLCGSCCSVYLLLLKNSRCLGALDCGDWVDWVDWVVSTGTVMKLGRRCVVGGGGRKGSGVVESGAIPLITVHLGVVLGAWHGVFVKLLCSSVLQWGKVRLWRHCRNEQIYSIIFCLGVYLGGTSSAGFFVWYVLINYHYFIISGTGKCRGKLK